MKSIIKFLECDENDWSLTLDKYRADYPLMEIVKKFNYILKSHNTIRSEVEKYLKDEIIKTLSDNNTTL